MIVQFDADAEQTELTSGVRIVDYRRMIAVHDHAAIAELIRARFKERYLEPVSEQSCLAPNGFAILAVCCLMVEAVESFRQGLKDTDGRSKRTFREFFQGHAEFAELRPVADEFYETVRCGILHQAETTGGWRVHRSLGILLRQENGIKWVSAAEFAVRLNHVLDSYCDTLRNAAWQDDVWIKARLKLKYICGNCGAVDVSML